MDPMPGAEGGSRFIRRDAQRRFTSEQVDVGRSLAAALVVLFTAFDALGLPRSPRSEH
jgi:hypothetical protein